MQHFKEYKSSLGEIILYTGNPKFQLLEELSAKEGDIWHSSFEQGLKNAFPDLVYQTAVFFWYLNDFDNVNQCVSWRINPKAFAVRKSVWEALGGFDADFESENLQALDFGYNALRNAAAIPLYVKGLYDANEISKVVISVKDRYVFYRKNFKPEHAFYMLFRKGVWKISEWKALLAALKQFRQRKGSSIVPPRKLAAIKGSPTVSYIIPTMMRQDFTLQLLEDLSKQTYVPVQVIVVDATPVEQRNESRYKENSYPFELIIKWQETTGSCRARNEAIELCTGDYIVFGDDDIRLPQDFIEKHLQLLHTYKAEACNGLDVRADHQYQDLEDLNQKLLRIEAVRWKVGASPMFSNANSMVKRVYVKKLIGNDINFDGGYGEDNDFGLSLSKLGITVLHNPFAVNLHLKPPVGGYRFWGNQSKILGKKRKTQPWELDTPVKWLRPVPSPTIVYGICKHFTPRQLIEYKYKYFFLYLFKKSKWTLIFRLFKLPYRILQFNKSVFYAQKLRALGKRTR